VSAFGLKAHNMKAQVGWTQNPGRPSPTRYACEDADHARQFHADEQQADAHARLERDEQGILNALGAKQKRPALNGVRRVQRR